MESNDVTCLTFVSGTHLWQVPQNTSTVFIKNNKSYKIILKLYIFFSNCFHFNSLLRFYSLAFPSIINSFSYREYIFYLFGIFFDYHIKINCSFVTIERLRAYKYGLLL